MKRRSISKKASRKDFRRNANRSHRFNSMPMVMRGGFRL